MQQYMHVASPKFAVGFDLGENIIGWPFYISRPARFAFSLFFQLFESRHLLFHLFGPSTS